MSDDKITETKKVPYQNETESVYHDQSVLSEFNADNSFCLCIRNAVLGVAGCLPHHYGAHPCAAHRTLVRHAVLPVYKHARHSGAV